MIPLASELHKLIPVIVLRHGLVLRCNLILLPLVPAGFG